jgi:hypothetical protein
LIIPIVWRNSDILTTVLCVILLWKRVTWVTECVYSFCSGRDSSVGIATAYGLDGPGIESRWGGFSAPVQTGPETHPTSCTMGTRPFPEVRCGRGVTQPLTLF